MNKAGIVVGALALALAVAGTAGVGSHFSPDDAPRNTAPANTCEKYGFKTSGDTRQITIEEGDTVSGKVTAPLADELGIGMPKAKAMVEHANPKVYNLDKVATGAVINAPNCAQESHG